MNTLTIRRPDDWHNHLRQDELLTPLVKETAKDFARTLVMPNTLPPIDTPEHLQKYHKQLKSVGTNLEFVMTFKVMPSLQPGNIKALKDAGAKAGKLYPQGVTTHSEDGVADLKALYPVFEAMQSEDLILCLHGEVPGLAEVDREKAFLPDLKAIAENFPHLRIILEHTSTKAAVEMVHSLKKNVAATITVHHMMLTIKDVQGVNHNHLNPHHWCAPICKSESDKKSLIEAAISGNPKFFFGSDSAPHLKESKESGHPKPGVYTTPVAMPLLAEVFEAQNALPQLEDFCSTFGADFYQVPYNSGKLTLEKKPWNVATDYNGIVPLRAGEQINWQVINEE